MFENNFLHVPPKLIMVIKNIWKDIDFYRTLFGMQGVNAIVVITCYDEENPGQVVSACYVFFRKLPAGPPILQL